MVACVPAPQQSVFLCWTLSSLSMSCLVCRAQDWTLFKMWCCQFVVVGNKHFGCALVQVAWYVIRCLPHKSDCCLLYNLLKRTLQVLFCKAAICSVHLEHVQVCEARPSQLYVLHFSLTYVRFVSPFQHPFSISQTAFSKPCFLLNMFFLILLYCCYTDVFKDLITPQGSTFFYY